MLPVQLPEKADGPPDACELLKGELRYAGWRG
jgi:hypothetical protein